MVKIAVLVSGGGTNLQALIDRQQAGELGCGQIGWCSAPARACTRWSARKKRELRRWWWTARAAPPPRNSAPGCCISCRARGVEMVVLAGFLSILCKDMVEAYPNRIINVHPSLIPSFCGKGFYGLKVHQAALDYGVKVTGATVHYVNEVTDGGSIILQKAVYIEPDDTPETLQRRVMEQAEWELLPQSDRNGLPKNPGGKGQTVTAREGEVSMNCVELAAGAARQYLPGQRNCPGQK